MRSDGIAITVCWKFVYYVQYLDETSRFNRVTRAVWNKLQRVKTRLYRKRKGHLVLGVLSLAECVKPNPNTIYSVCIRYLCKRKVYVNNKQNMPLIDLYTVIRKKQPPFTQKRRLFYLT